MTSAIKHPFSCFTVIQISNSTKESAYAYVSIAYQTVL